MTTDTSSLERLQAAQALFYSNSDLDDAALLRVLGRMTPAGADWADIYLQQTVSSHRLRRNLYARLYGRADVRFAS